VLPFDGGADFIAIASNAVNCRFSADGSPRIGIVEATCQQVQQLGVCRIGLLASTATVSSRGYEVEFAAAGIEVVTPGAGDQEVVEQVVGALNGWPSVMPDRVAFLRVLADLSNEVDAVVLGSTPPRQHRQRVVPAGRHRDLADGLVRRWRSELPGIMAAQRL